MPLPCGKFSQILPTSSQAQGLIIGRAEVMQLCTALIGWLTWGQFSTSLSHTQAINQERSCASWTAANSSTPTIIKKKREKRCGFSIQLKGRCDPLLGQTEYCSLYTGAEEERKETLTYSSRIVQIWPLEDKEVHVASTWLVTVFLRSEEKCKDFVHMRESLYRHGKVGCSIAKRCLDQRLYDFVCPVFLHFFSHELNSANNLCFSCLITPAESPIILSHQRIAEGKEPPKHLPAVHAQHSRPRHASYFLFFIFHLHRW